MPIQRLVNRFAAIAVLVPLTLHGQGTSVPATDDTERRDQLVTAEDVAILQRADEILSSADVWNRLDTRVCNQGDTTWSLFCALERSSIFVLGEYHHRGVALQEVRFAVEDASKGMPFEHRLMDYNNLPTTTFDDIKRVLHVAYERVAVRFAAQNARSTHAAGSQAAASAGQSRTLTIPFLANNNKPADLDFMAAQCELATNGEQMVCRFRQIFLTVSSIDAASCVMTTSGYEQVFRRINSTRWESESAPEGECGSVETATLEDGGLTRWTLTLRVRATRNTDQPSCRAVSPAEVYDWTSVKRPLPCTFIQPGAIER